MPGIDKSKTHRSGRSLPRIQLKNSSPEAHSFITLSPGSPSIKREKPSATIWWSSTMTTLTTLHSVSALIFHCPSDAQHTLRSVSGQGVFRHIFGDTEHLARSEGTFAKAILGGFWEIGGTPESERPGRNEKAPHRPDSGYPTERAVPVSQHPAAARATSASANDAEGRISNCRPSVRVP